MTQRASFATRSSWLGTEFGESFARRQFGDEAVDALPRYVKGKNVGKHKATIQWTKVEEGGWVSAGAAGYGHVERRVGQIIGARIVLTKWKSSDVDVLASKGDLSRIDG